MTDAYGNVQTDLPHIQPVIHPHASRYTNTEFNGSCGVLVHHRLSFMNVAFLPGFHREALKRALNRKQDTSEISQATRAW